MADSTPKSYHTDPTLYLYTSLTAGSSHIITATSRLETILKANRIPFQALDVATDEKARMLWGRRAGKRKLPGLVRMGMLDLEEVEEWNEYGELKEKVGVPTKPSTPSTTNTPTKMPASASTPSKLSTSDAPFQHTSSIESPSRTAAPSQTESPMAAALRQAGKEAAKKAGDAKAKTLAKAGVPSKLPSETQKNLVNDEPEEEAKASPERDVYEGQGTKDPDREAVVRDSKDTINLEGKEEGGGSDVKSSDPDAEAVIPDSRDTIDGKENAASSEKAADSNDPDVEAAVPGSKGRIDSEEKGFSNLGITSRRSDNDKSNVRTEGQGRNSVENTTKAAAASDGAQDLPGKRTQDQDPANAEEAGASVAD
ncbi:MAG: hypothetical protein Q9225_000505 [Loekoesia sp. 1 TL-2023]